jgi:protein-tyrosine phosphatase
VQERPERLAGVVTAGTLVQLTAASLDGRLGRSSRAAAFRLLDLGLAHVIASDAHAPTIRQIGMRAAAETVGGGALAQWLTLDVPRALLDGRPLPERPEPQTTRARRLPWRRTN